EENKKQLEEQQKTQINRKEGAKKIAAGHAENLAGKIEQRASNSIIYIARGLFDIALGLGWTVVGIIVSIIILPISFVLVHFGFSLRKNAKDVQKKGLKKVREGAQMLGIKSDDDSKDEGPLAIFGVFSRLLGEEKAGPIGLLQQMLPCDLKSCMSSCLMSFLGILFGLFILAVILAVTIKYFCTAGGVLPDMCSLLPSSFLQ
ncbi:MAG: hypothetical protein NTU97_01165, partial [Candidatus Magasanikbacteria bacterium]|nr:hypothetical protein [Candidatus Magasanikbacteria bacterium]